MKTVYIRIKWCWCWYCLVIALVEFKFYKVNANKKCVCDWYMRCNVVSELKFVLENSSSNLQAFYRSVTERYWRLSRSLWIMDSRPFLFVHRFVCSVYRMKYDVVVWSSSNHILWYDDAYKWIVFGRKGTSKIQVIYFIDRR